MTTPDQPGTNPVSEPTNLSPTPQHAAPVEPGPTPVATGATAVTPEPKKNSTLIKGIIGAVIAAAMLLGLAFVVPMLMNDAPKVGDCIAVKGDDKEAAKKKIKCDDTSKGTTYHVVDVKKDGSECAKEFMPFQETKKGKVVASYCLVPNFEAGKCYGEKGEGKNTTLDTVECKVDPNATSTLIRVAEKIDKADGTCKDSQTQPISFSKPNNGVTYCVAPVR